MTVFNVSISYMKHDKLPVYETQVEAAGKEQAEALAKQEARAMGFNGTVKKVTVKAAK